MKNLILVLVLLPSFVIGQDTPIDEIKVSTEQMEKNFYLNNSYQTTADLNKTYFIDEEIGFIAGDGVVLKTNNGGQTWTSIKEDKNIKFRSIHFENKSIGLVGGNDGFYSYVYLTNNGGLTWEQILRVWYSNESNEVINLFGNKNSRNIILFVNQYPNGYSEQTYDGAPYTPSIQAYGHVYVSKNAGEDWNELDKVTIGRPGISSAFKLNDKIYFMSKTIWSWTVSAWATSFYESYFLDEQSERIDVHNSDNIISNDMFFNSELGFSCGNQGSFAITSDAGKNWTSKTIQGYSESNFTSIDFNSNSEGILSTDEGEILISPDNGQSWSLKYDLGKKINDIKFLNQNKFIVIGDEGLLEILEF